MDGHSELIHWLKRMGYDGKVPETLGNICNNSTSFIWDQLIQNAKPKQEVDNLRNNIIIHRLRSKPLNKQDEFPYPVGEIDLYMKKQSLEKKLSNLKNIINEKKQKLGSLSQNNKMKYVTVEKLKSKIKENEEREYLLDKKGKMLEKNIQDAEETLLCAKNLTPVELDENPNTKEVTETLQKCAEKLEKHLQNIPPPSSYNSTTQSSFRQFHSVQKQPRIQSTFEKHLMMSEKKYSTTFKQKRDNRRVGDSNKENVDSNKRINKNLFGDVQEPNNKKNNRESLGILHESHIRDNESDFSTVELVDNLFFSPLSSNKNINITTPPLSIKTGKLNLKSNSFLNEQYCVRKSFNFEMLYNNEFLTKNLKNLLYSHNRRIIWNTVQTLNENLNLELARSITFDSGNSSRNVTEDDIAKLQFLHIQTELQTLKFNAISKDLSGKIEKKKRYIYAVITKKGISPEKAEFVGRLFEEQLEDVGLDAVLAEMRKEISSTKMIEDCNDLQIILGKIAQTKDEIVQRIATIKHYINSTYETLQSTVHTREQTVACVKKQGPFVEDLTWAEPLTEKLCSAETKMFEKFPLEYNRRCTYTQYKLHKLLLVEEKGESLVVLPHNQQNDPRVHYRDIADIIPTDVDVDLDTLYMLTSILDSPFSPPETVLLNLLKSKMKLNALKSLKNNSPEITYKKYSLKELQDQESYVQYALDKLNSIIYSTSSSKTLATADVIKKVMEIWVEMPMKDFISPKRAIEGKDYKFFERQYDSFYKNI